MKRITIPNYIPTTTKGVHSDLEVTYTIDDPGYLPSKIVIDEVFCNDANLTELLSDIAKQDLAKEVQRVLMRKQEDAEIARWGM